MPFLESPAPLVSEPLFFIFSIFDVNREVVALNHIRSLTALDLARYGIRVNAICPSWVETPMIDRAVAGDPNLAMIMKRVVPLGRIATKEEVSDVLMFMSSPRASYVTGAGWMVDGGATLQLQT
jgi:NAD(P)-dependent dehydrogenase (short-subunit alcohol dehydrogenase family)